MFAGGAISCDEHTSDITSLSRVIESDVQFINGLRAEGIQAFGSIKSDSNGSVGLRSMIGDVCEVKFGNDVPMVYVKWIV